MSLTIDKYVASPGPANAEFADIPANPSAWDKLSGAYDVAPDDHIIGDLLQAIAEVDDRFLASAHDAIPRIAERNLRMREVMARCPAHGSAPPSEQFIVAQKIERWIAEFLIGAAPAEKLVALQSYLWFSGNQLWAQRVYRYIVWKRQQQRQRIMIAAVIRARNEALLLRVILPSVLSYFDEVVVVDHKSEDETAAVLRSFATAKLKVFRYPTASAPYGVGYAGRLRNGGGSLADYYNFSFARAEADYVCKWDADMLPLPSLGDLLGVIRVEQPAVVDMTGVDSMGLVTCNHEPRIYRRDLGLRYVDAMTCEMLDLSSATGERRTVQPPVYVHIKSSLKDLGKSRRKALAQHLLRWIPR